MKWTQSQAIGGKDSRWELVHTLSFTCWLELARDWDNRQAGANIHSFSEARMKFGSYLISKGNFWRSSTLTLCAQWQNWLRADVSSFHLCYQTTNSLVKRQGWIFISTLSSSQIPFTFSWDHQCSYSGMTPSFWGILLQTLLPAFLKLPLHRKIPADSSGLHSDFLVTPHCASEYTSETCKIRIHHRSRFSGRGGSHPSPSPYCHQFSCPILYWIHGGISGLPLHVTRIPKGVLTLVNETDHCTYQFGYSRETLSWEPHLWKSHKTGSLDL